MFKQIYLLCVCVVMVYGQFPRRVLTISSTKLDPSTVVEDQNIDILGGNIEDGLYEIHDIRLSTHADSLAKGQYPSQLELSINVFNQQLDIELKQYVDLFHENYRHHHMNHKGTFVHKPELTNCLYRGYVEGIEQSSAMISLCEKYNNKVIVSGYIRLNGEKYSIQPLRRGNQTVQQHMIFNVEHIKEYGTCETAHSPDHDIVISSKSHPVQQDIPPPNQRIHQRVLVEREVKYIKMLIVNDKKRYDAYLGNTHAHSAVIISEVQDLYDALSNMPNSKFEFRIQIVGMITFEIGDPWNGKLTYTAGGTVDAVQINDLFEDWVRKNANLRMGTDYAVAHLLSGQEFTGSTVGIAYLYGACRSRSASGSNQATSPSDHLIATTVAHELAHNLGVEHTTESNPNSAVKSPCESEEEDFLMDPAGAGQSTWSTCTKAYVEQFFLGYPFGCSGSSCTVAPSYGNPEQGSKTCMDSPSDSLWTGVAVCGDGFRQDDEECDCGATDCSEIDPCCNGATCKYVSGATCSSMDDCCDQCNIIPASANKICRAALSECDFDEVCNGASGSCPTDSYRQPGAECTHEKYGNGLCFLGSCMTKYESCDKYSGSNGLPIFDGESCDLQNECSQLECNAKESNKCYGLFLSSGRPLVPIDGTPCGNKSDKMCSRGQCVEPKDVEIPQSLICSNGVLDIGETDVDCGGICFPCTSGKTCFTNSDCYGTTENPATCDIPDIGGTGEEGDEPANGDETPPPDDIDTQSPTKSPTQLPEGMLPEGKQCYMFSDKDCASYDRCIVSSGKCKATGSPIEGCGSMLKKSHCRRYSFCSWVGKASECRLKKNLARRLEDEFPTSGRLSKGICRNKYAVFDVEEDSQIEIWIDEFLVWFHSNLMVSIPVVIVAGLLFLCFLQSCCASCWSCFCGSEKKGKKDKPKPKRQKSIQRMPSDSQTIYAEPVISIQTAAPTESNQSNTQADGIRISSQPKTSIQVENSRIGSQPTRASAPNVYASTASARMNTHPTRASAPNVYASTASARMDTQPSRASAPSIYASTPSVPSSTRQPIVRPKCSGCFVKYGDDSHDGYCDTCWAKREERRRVRNIPDAEVASSVESDNAIAVEEAQPVYL